MRSSRLTRALCASAVVLLCQFHSAFGAEECRCAPSPAPERAIPRLLGIDYAGTRLDEVGRLRRGDLLGALKMSGTWVSKLRPDAFARAAVAACRYAADRGQDFYLQVPTNYASRDIASSLEQLAASECRPAGFAIGNEVDRLVTERIVERYTSADYVSDYNRIVPLAAKRFPAAKIIALELSSFLVKRYRPDDSLEVKYRPVFEWLVPFNKAALVRKPDYVSIHYYPFTGAQKDWETLAAGGMFAAILHDLAPVLAQSPPLVIGEFNTTYQYEGATVYPESGGDSFMAALTVPDLFADPLVRGVFHWSLTDNPPSTLGLYQGKELAPMPLLQAYRMVADALDHDPVAAHAAKPDLEVRALRKGGRYRVYIVNTGPFFRRGLTVSGREGADIRVDSLCGCRAADVAVTLPPLSITELAGDLSDASRSSQRRYANGDRVVRSGPLPASAGAPAHCATLADFAQRTFAGAHFENPAYNQNTKIATGGTFISLASPGGHTTLRREGDVLTLACDLPKGGHDYYRCGVKLPFVTDAAGDRGAGVDWREGRGKGAFRLTIESEAPVAVEMHLEDFKPQAVGQNTHQKTAQVSGVTVVDAPLAQFAQLPGKGIPRPLEEILGNAAALRIEVRQPGFAGRLRIHKLEVCDTL